MRALLLVAMLLAAMLLGGPAQAKRVVSLNLCTDQYLLLLAPEQAAGVTFLAAEPALSALADKAAGVPTVRADAESVLALRPELVLAAPWGAQPTLAALERRGVPVLRLNPPADFPAIRAETARLAAALGVPARGAAAIAAVDATLAALPSRPPRPALALQPRGWTGGEGALLTAVMRAAGLVDTGTGARLGLEALAAHPPALLVTAEAPRTPSLGTDMLWHPVLAGIERRTVPPAWVICGGPWSAQAASRLAQ